MTPAVFRDALVDLDLTQAAFAREVTAEAGRRLEPQQVWRYAAGRSKVPTGLAAYINLRLRLKILQRALR